MAATSARPGGAGGAGGAAGSRLLARAGAVRRRVPDDNSCLFAALAYLLEGGRQHAATLRAAAAAAVEADPQTFTEAVLGQPRDAYVRWITDPKRWGGEIELTALARLYSTEVVVREVRSQTRYAYGAGMGHAWRVFLLYDGVHYDALAWSPRGGPEAEDVLRFPADDADPATSAAEAGAEALAREELRRGRFVNLAGFTLRCEVCGEGAVGQEGAVRHASATGHKQFSEYR